MNMDANEVIDPLDQRKRTFSNASQLSQQSSKHNFPLVTSDSGLYTCSSNTSDCSLQFESDTDFCQQSKKTKGFKDDRLQLALQDVRKLHSELERLTKSEQWYKQELKQQKSTRLNDLERIYTQERKFMLENQRLQKECVRLYEKCNELEKELEKQNQDFHEQRFQGIDGEEGIEDNLLEFEKQQHLALIKDQQQLISVLRKQKRSLLQDLRSLAVEKDEKVNELQRVLADLEFENKLITKKCTQYAKERINLEETLKQTENKISVVQEEKMNLQKSIVVLKEKLEVQQQLLKIKEREIEEIQQHYIKKIQNEEDLDQVHELSLKYQKEINLKTLEIINLKKSLQEMQDNLEEMKSLQEQNELQKKQIDQLTFIIEEHRLEIQELKELDQHKSKQNEELHATLDNLVKYKETSFKTTVEQENELLVLKSDLASTQHQYEQVQELYKDTKFQLELLEVEHGKAKFKNDSDRKEIGHLRNKLKEYLEETTELSSKIQMLESELKKVLKENSKLKNDKQMLIANNKENQKLNKEIQQKKDEDDLTTNLLAENSFNQQDSNKGSDDQDFLELQYQCQKLQDKLDFIRKNQGKQFRVNNKAYFENHQLEQVLNRSINTDLNVENDDNENSTKANIKNVDADMEFTQLSLQGCKLQENLEKLNVILKEKVYLLSNLTDKQSSNENMDTLVKENEILKKKMNAIRVETLAYQIKDELNERTQKYIKMEDNLVDHTKEIESIRRKLLENDSKLYKMERNPRKVEENEPELAELKIENTNLELELRQVQANKTDLNRMLKQEANEIKELRQSLEDLKMQNGSTKNQATQCALTENVEKENTEVMELREHILHLQQEQRHFLEQEALKKEERLRLLQQMMNLQNNKIQNLQQHQKDWDDVVTALNETNALEEKTRKELELKRMELEELNQVFAEQNEEFRKLEQFTALLEAKRQNEKEQLKLTFQQEINVMKLHLQDCQNEIEQLKLLNKKLEKQNDRFQQDINPEYGSEVAGYKKEIRELKSRAKRITEENDDLLEHVNELENQTKVLKDKKREAILLSDFSLVKTMDASVQNSAGSLDVLKQNIPEDHLRVLTKVLEAEYQRKMLRYDEHIHSLLSNLKSLKNSLKINEERTALLSEEQIKTREELKDLQSTKRSLEKMRLKYEQSQNTIKELNDKLALERNKFELSDFGKSSKIGTNYEVSNLIDDYKKLIQQSAIATKRPSTSAILDLIQRSNQCVPNFHKLETNVDGLRSDLQNFLASYSHRIPAATSLIATASLSVPPSLMDELRVASEGF